MSHKTRKLRILCLHGYQGSARMLRGQLAPLAAELEPIAELVFIDAPALETAGCGWWRAVDDERASGAEEPGVSGARRHYKGWPRTREAIVACFEEQGPFDGVLGFSQGAALAGLLVGLRAPDGHPTSDRPLRFGFAIMIGGFSSRDTELARLYAQRDSYALPSLHVFGSADGIVPATVSRALAAHFASAIVVEHAGGHIIPGEPHVRERVREFLEVQAAETRREPVEISLWPGRTAPAMRVIFPKGQFPEGQSAATAALVVFRGAGPAASVGGVGAAEWAAEHGMVGVEVPYRCAGTGDAHPASYADAARAVRLVRERAAAWGVDPARVGVLGFSAGGHLASLLSTQPTLHIDPDDDLASRFSARPDFVLLAYPLISFVEGYTPDALLSSTQNLFGQRDPDEALRRRFSSELHVAPDHPPVFLWTTADDAIVPASHSQRFAEACERAGVPVMFKLFPHGLHGMGLALDQGGDVGEWTLQALAWLADRKLLAPPGR